MHWQVSEKELQYNTGNKTTRNEIERGSWWFGDSGRVEGRRNWKPSIVMESRSLSAHRRPGQVMTKTNCLLLRNLGSLQWINLWQKDCVLNAVEPSNTKFFKASTSSIDVDLGSQCVWSHVIGLDEEDKMNVSYKNHRSISSIADRRKQCDHWDIPVNQCSAELSSRRETYSNELKIRGHPRVWACRASNTDDLSFAMKLNLAK